MITNKHDIGLSIALMLAVDDYDYDPRPNSISATSLLKPLRVLALQAIHKNNPTEIDVTQLVASRTGTAVHDKLEATWLNPDKVKRGLTRLGFKDPKVLVNPTPDQIAHSPNHSVVWVEQRAEKALIINGDEFILTGKFDIVLNGKLEDLKNTGSFKVIKTIKEEERFIHLKRKLATTNDIGKALALIQEECPTIFEYAFQGSVYRMLNPDKITEDFMSIQFIMKDWYKGKVGEDYYPDINPYQFDIDLFSKEEVMAYIIDTLTELKEIIDTKELPLCSNKELWIADPVFKVYKDSKSKRALPKGTFETHQEAIDFNSKRKVPGVIKCITSPPRRCGYCNVKEVCDQYKKFIKTGVLKEEK
jgi:hypothetical protein